MHQVYGLRTKYFTEKTRAYLDQARCVQFGEDFPPQKRVGAGMLGEALHIFQICFSMIGNTSCFLGSKISSVSLLLLDEPGNKLAGSY